LRYFQTIIICGLLLSCTSPSLTSQKMPPIAEIQWWKEHFQNNPLLSLKIDLTHCVESADKINDAVWKLTPFPHGMSRAGVLLHPHPDSIRQQWWGSHQDFLPNTLSVSVVPYITNTVGEKLVLLPEIHQKLTPPAEHQSRQLCRREGNELRCDQPFNRFLPACAPEFDQFANAYPHFYPIVLLTVDNANHFKVLEEFLRKSSAMRQPLEFTSSALPVGETEDMSHLLTQIFEKEQAQFLKSLPFTVKVTLPNEILPLEQQLSHFVFDPQKLMTSVPSDTKKSYFTLVYPHKIAGSPVAGCDLKTDQPHTLVCEPKEYQVADLCHADTMPVAHLHKLVVISLSEGFGKQSQAIKAGLAEMFLELQATKTPFTVLASSGELYTLLTSKQLFSLPEGDRRNFIARQLESGMQFSAGNFSALDLDLVDNLVQMQRQTSTAIGRIFYLTDNRGLSGNPQEIPKNKWGVPFSWRKEGITVKILTSKTEGCKVWHYVDATCIPWQGEELRLKNALKSELNQFLSEP